MELLAATAMERPISSMSMPPDRSSRWECSSHSEWRFERAVVEFAWTAVGVPARWATWMTHSRTAIAADAAGCLSVSPRRRCSGGSSV